MFRSRTIEGLMELIHENNGTSLGIYDEFTSFIDNLDKGSNGNSEQELFLTLLNGMEWNNRPKTNDRVSITYSRLN